jgi:hypothetical protein
MSPPRRGRGLKHEMRDAADTLNLSALSKDASEFRHVYNANSYTDPLDLGTHTDDIRKMMEAINIQLLYYTQEWGADIVSSSKNWPHCRTVAAFYINPSPNAFWGD